jgi:hypothetical protein
MNFKALSVIIATAALSHVASASPINVKFKPSGQMKTQDSPTPIRTAKAHVLVEKTWNEKQSDGSYKQMSEMVCNVTDQFPVFEVQGGSINYSPSTFTTCKTNLKVGASSIQVMGLVGFLDNLNDPFNGGTQASWKAFVAGFNVVNDAGTFSKLGGMSVNAVENQTEKTMIVIADSSGLTTDNSGDTSIDEHIQVAVRIEDQ